MLLRTSIFRQVCGALFLRFLCSEVSEGGFSSWKNLSLYYTSVIRNRFCLGSYFIPALGFSFILLFPSHDFLKVINFQMWHIMSKSKHHEVKISFKSHHWQKNSSKAQNRCWSERLSLRSIKLRINYLAVFPWFLLALWSENIFVFCASLISYSLLTARNSKQKSLQIIKRWPKVTKYRYATTILLLFLK